MNETRTCPECDSWDTERVHVEWMTDEVEETRICNDCPTQYRVIYGRPIIEVDEVPDA